VTEWRLLELDAIPAARASLPQRVLAPADEDVENEPITRERVAAWSNRFIAENPATEQAAELQPLVDKEPLWVRLVPALETEDWAVAMPLLEEILTVDPTDAAAVFNHSSGLRAAGLREEALRELEAIRPVFEGEGIYHANVGRTLLELERPAEAETEFRRALELLPGDEFVTGQLVALGAMMPVLDEEGNEGLVWREDFEEAVREDLAQNAGDADYLTTVSSTLLEQGHDRLALRAAELAMATGDGRPELPLYAGIASGRLEDLPGSLTHLDRHLAAVPASAIGQLHRANVLWRIGRQDEARAVAERALELDPQALPAIEILVATDDGIEAAYANVLALVARYPGSWAVQRAAGDLAFGADFTEEAIDHYRQAVEAGADDASLAAILGELGRRGHLVELVEIADEIPRLSERDPHLRWNAALAYHAFAAAPGGEDRSGEARIVLASIVHDDAAPPDMRQAAQALLDQPAEGTTPPTVPPVDPAA
jgi:tetratricopeptide (TPR) repeat protein